MALTFDRITQLRVRLGGGDHGIGSGFLLAPRPGRCPPETFTPALATSLNSLSVRLSDLGRREDALTAVDEAVALYRELHARDPRVFARPLATILAFAGELHLGTHHAQAVVDCSLQAAALAQEFEGQALFDPAVGTLREEARNSREDFAAAWRRVTDRQPPASLLQDGEPSDTA